jgi:phospholipid/cholesterol/gamma-HCH transport system permease protein
VDTPERQIRSVRLRVLLAPFSIVGGTLISALDQIGQVTWLFLDGMGWVLRSLIYRKVRIGRPALVSQTLRVGVRSVFIVSLVSACVGLILALQLAPSLDQFGQRELIANIIGVAVLRELGPLIGAIVLTGFAGASIAAEIGTMVVGEEVEALEAHALDPVRFLVVPRVAASLISMTILGIIADLVAIVASLGISMTVLEIPYEAYMTNFLNQVKPVDFYTGVGKSAIFGLLIGLIACKQGLSVSGGAAGVGRATTYTVVHSVVAIIFADLAFTTIFFALKMV